MLPLREQHWSDVWVGAHNIDYCDEGASGHDHLKQWWIECNGWDNKLKGLQYSYIAPPISGERIFIPIPNLYLVLNFVILIPCLHRTQPLLSNTITTPIRSNFGTLHANKSMVYHNYETNTTLVHTTMHVQIICSHAQLKVSFRFLNRDGQVPLLKLLDFPLQLCWLMTLIFVLTK